MNDNQPGISDQLRLKFPNLKPIKSPPTLFRFNGCGVSVYGKRDYDKETQTFVKTYCVSLVFIPLFALGAYRVALARNGGWYFLGKEPLSRFASSWNVAMICAAVFITLSAVWDARTSTPEYRAQQEIKRAGDLMKAGQALQAAGVYRQQLNGPADAAARNGFKEAAESCLQGDKPEPASGALHLIAGLPANANQPAPLVPEAFNRGLALVDKFRATSPEAALAVLEADAELDPTNPAVAPKQIDLLKQIVAANPNDTNHVVALAVAYENGRQMEDCWALLRPYKDRLGATEGARILGQKLLDEQNYAEAYGLLFPYVQNRLDMMRGIEISYSNTVASISHKALADLNRGDAGPDFYRNYKAATKEQQDTMVDDYIQSRMKGDPGYARALADLKEANRIVPVALDLGIVQLNRAQGLQDAAARKTELEAAEKTFLAIRGFAGETDEYRLFLGQVYYWLGKSKEGRELFDQLLASRNREYSILMSISQTLRAVGDQLEARNLSEEAYTSAKENKEKYSAATLRSLLNKDNEDRITWLQRADPDAAFVQIELNEARGLKALQQANKPLAAEYLRKAISGYDTQPKSSSTLNNCALACFELYEATGNVADQKRGLAMLEEAVAMDPGDSILLHNTGYYLLNRAVMDVNHDAINFAMLGEQADLDALPFLYRDEPGRAQIFRQLRDTEAMKKGLGYLDKELLLAPKAIGAYSTALALEGSFRDLAALQKLQQRFQIAAPDLAEGRRDAMESYAGKKDKEYLDKLEKRIQSFKDLARQCATNGDTLTLEYVTVSLNELQQSAWTFGGEADGREMLQTALSAYQRHESSASRQALQSAYFFAAGEALARQSPEYATLVRQTRHALPAEYLISLVLERGGPLADLVRKNENVVQAVGMEKEILALFPSWASTDEWAMLRNVDPDRSAVAAKRIKENETMRLVDSLQYQFNPWSARLVLEQYWTQELLGDSKRAAELYQNAIRDGVPLPPL